PKCRLPTSAVSRRFTQKLPELERERVAVQRQVDATSTFPIQTSLPFEIAVKIFSLHLPTFPGERGRMKYLRREEMIQSPKSEAPVVFTGVCRAWRDIALASPELWSTLEFTLRVSSRNTPISHGTPRLFVARPIPAPHPWHAGSNSERVQAFVQR
ncbi:hypothetical protein DFH07DRAFT_1001348, partial [Mycena maculata]